MRRTSKPGLFGSVKDLNAKMRAFIDGWNDRAYPFVWTKTAEEILAKANRPKDFRNEALVGLAQFANRPTVGATITRHSCVG